MVTLSAHTTAEPRAPSELQPGAQLAKYRLRRIVGSGGMGVVWAAHDPDLDREVAVKLLHGDGADPSSRTRLLREARAMARLKHPNVLTVYEVGTDANRDYVVMELVEGGSLDRWLATRPPRAQVFAAIIAAGRGLAAAHAADLVHRDFKPHNVLRASDGRVLVTDFGLARECRDTDELVESPPSRVSGLEATLGKPAVDSVLGSPLTRSGLLVGTPAYMAPEQLAGARSDATTDQYAFCVAAWQALSGHRPFAGDSIDELRTAALAGPARIKATIVPAVRAVLERGLDPDPGKRWPDLDTLLRALVRAHRRRTVVAMAVAAIVVVVGATAGILALANGRAAACTGGDEMISAVWNEHIKTDARAAFLSTKQPYALFAWNHTSQALDDYGHAWRTMRIGACEATAHREQSTEVMDLRMGCLAERLRAFGAATELFAHADTQTVSRAATVVGGLPAIAGCTDVGALTTAIVPPKDLSTTIRVEAARADLARARVLVLAGRYRDADLALTAALAAARTTSYLPLVADALRTRGEQQWYSGQPDVAKGTFEEAFVTAESARADELAMGTAAQLARLIGSKQPDDGMVWVRIAEAKSKRVNSHSPDLALVASARGVVLRAAGHYAEALASFREALAIRQVGPETSNLAVTLSEIGDTLAITARYDQALVELRNALAIRQRLLGPDHPAIGDSHDAIGGTLMEEGKYDEAVPELRAALAIRERALGPDHIDVMKTRMNLADAIDGMGDHEGALVELHRGLASAEHATPPDPHDLAMIHAATGRALGGLHREAEATIELRQALALEATRAHPGSELPTMYISLGNRLDAQHQYDAALVELRHGRAVGEQLLGPDHPFVAAADADIGEVLVHQGKFADALVALDRALATYLKVFGPDHPNTGETLASIGLAHLGLHDRVKAADELGRALAILEPTVDPETLAELRFAVARASVDDRKTRAHAIALATQARAAYAKLANHGHELHEIDAWLAHRS